MHEADDASQHAQVGFCKMGLALSPDGRCKTFDESANGFTRADGAGAIVLELASDAQKAMLRSHQGGSHHEGLHSREIRGSQGIHRSSTHMALSQQGEWMAEVKIWVSCDKSHQNCDVFSGSW